MPKSSFYFLCLAMLSCNPLIAGDRDTELAEFQTRIQKLEAGVQGVESVRAIKRLQYAYGHYAELGLWHDLADLFADNGIGHYPSGNLRKEEIRKLFLQEVGKGKLGLGEGQLYPHIMLQPVVTLSPGGKTAHGRWRVLAMLGGYGGKAVWAGGIYENEYILENGVWKINDLRYHSRFSGLYDQPGWNADKGEVPFHFSPTQAGKPIPDNLILHNSSVKPAKLGDLGKRLRDITQRILRLNDESEVENLQHIYGYYVDRKMWDDVADLFAPDATVELGSRGVYTGRTSIRRALNQFGPAGLREGELNDRLQLQTLVSVSSDGRRAKARCIELAMTGMQGKGGKWEEGIFENEFTKKSGIWRIQSLHFYPRLITDYSKGWAKDAKPAPGPSKEFPPDRLSSRNYNTYPAFQMVPFHFANPVTGRSTRYPAETIATHNTTSSSPAGPPASSFHSAAAIAKGIAEAERLLEMAKSYDASENLASAYGYYLDDFRWDETADLFTLDAKRDLSSIGSDTGRENIRQSLKRRYPGNKSYEYLIVHQLVQPVIHVAADGRTANMRVRLFQLAGPSGGNGSWIAGIYETSTFPEDGIWKFKTMKLDYTWSADYRRGWANISDPSKGIVATPFPKILELPFHYANPVSGRKPPLFGSGR